MFYTEFHPHRSKNMEITGRNPLTPTTKASLTKCRFSRNSQFLYNILYRTKFHENPTNVLATDNMSRAGGSGLYRNFSFCFEKGAYLTPSAASFEQCESRCVHTRHCLSVWAMWVTLCTHQTLPVRLSNVSHAVYTLDTACPFEQCESRCVHIRHCLSVWAMWLTLCTH
jgi:hypothetical protein